MTPSQLAAAITQTLAEATDLRHGERLCLGEAAKILNALDLGPVPCFECRRAPCACTPSEGQHAAIIEFMGRHPGQWPTAHIATAQRGTLVLRRNQDGAVNVTGVGSYSNRPWFGKIGHDGVFRSSSNAHRLGWADAIIQALNDFAHDPQHMVAAYGHQTDHCSFCQTELTDERSTAAGYGPICAGTYGLPWGTA